MVDLSAPDLSVGYLVSRQNVLEAYFCSSIRALHQIATDRFGRDRQEIAIGNVTTLGLGLRNYRLAPFLSV